MCKFFHSIIVFMNSAALGHPELLYVLLKCSLTDPRHTFFGTAAVFPSTAGVQSFGFCKNVVEVSRDVEAGLTEIPFKKKKIKNLFDAAIIQM